MSVIDVTQLIDVPIIEHADQAALRQVVNLSNQALHVLQVPPWPIDDARGHPHKGMKR